MGDGVNQNKDIKVAICWMDISGYMAACWSELNALENIDLRVITQPITNNNAFDTTIMAGIDWCPMEDTDDQSQFEQLRVLLEKFQPDIVVISGWASTPYKKLTKMHWLKRPVFLLAMDTPWRGDIRQLLAKYILSGYLRLFEGVMVPGENTKRYAKYLGFDENQILEPLYGFDAKAFTPRTVPRMVATNERRFLYVGRYAPEKGIKTLINAYTKYRAKSQNPWQLVCCGQGPEIEYIEETEGVVNLGFVQPNDLPRIFCDSDCFVFPSNYEPWGVALTEACGSGLPVIVSRNVGAATALVSDGENGYLFDSGDIDQLCEAMLKIEQRTSTLLQMGEVSVIKAQTYSSKKWALQWRAALKRFLGPDS